MNESIKKIWDIFTDRFGNTILHPQYVIKKYTYEGVKTAQKHARGKLIDIGCGRMPYRKKLEPYVSSYIGLDHPTVSQLYKNSKYKPDILADATKIPVKSKNFDTAVMFEVLVDLPDPKKALREVHRILKPSGYLILSSPFMYPIQDPDYDYARYTDVGIRKMLQETGFKSITIEAKGTFLEFFYLSLIVFLFKRTKELPTVFVAFMIIPLIPLYVVINSISFLIAPFLKKLPNMNNYFVLDYIVVAKA